MSAHSFSMISFGGGPFGQLLQTHPGGPPCMFLKKAKGDEKRTGLKKAMKTHRTMIFISASGFPVIFSALPACEKNASSVFMSR
jgi:hypothetical protein